MPWSYTCRRSICVLPRIALGYEEKPASPFFSLPVGIPQSSATPLRPHSREPPALATVHWRPPTPACHCEDDWEPVHGSGGCRLHLAGLGHPEPAVGTTVGLPRLPRPIGSDQKLGYTNYLIACLRFSSYFTLLKFVFRCTHGYTANYQEIIELMYMQFPIFFR
jgi:hypothetical protein